MATKNVTILGANTNVLASHISSYSTLNGISALEFTYINDNDNDINCDCSWIGIYFSEDFDNIKNAEQQYLHLKNKYNKPIFIVFHCLFNQKLKKQIHLTLYEKLGSVPLFVISPTLNETEIIFDVLLQNSNNIIGVLRKLNKKHNWVVGLYVADELINKQDNNQITGYLYKLHFLHQIGNLNGALETAEKATNLMPNNSLCWKNKSVLLHKLNQNQEAISAIKKAIQLNPCDCDAHQNLATYLAECNLYEEAINECNTAIKYNSGHIISYRTKAMCYDKIGNSDLAIKTIESILNIEDSRTYCSYGFYLSKQQRYDEALAVTEKAIELDKNNVTYQCNKAEFLIVLGKEREALVTAKYAVSLDDEERMADAYGVLGLAYGACEKYAKACKYKYMCIEREQNWAKKVLLYPPIRRMWDSLTYWCPLYKEISDGECNNCDTDCVPFVASLLWRNSFYVQLCVDDLIFDLLSYLSSGLSQSTLHHILQAE